MYTKIIKPVFDFVGSFSLLLLVSPIIFVLIIALFIANKGKPFFFQLRPGKNEKLFKIIKFKTMTDEKDALGALLPDSKRLTTVGKFVRKTSLDEIPQLINVLKGDMSFVGPRPLLIKYLPYYSDREKFRHTVRPGITGLAQINGRNTLNWNNRLKLDIYYVKNISLLLDIKIILLTIRNVLIKKDVVVDTSQKMKDLNEERKHNL